MHLQLVHLQHSRSQRIVWLLEELQQPYALITHHVSQTHHKYPYLILKHNTHQERALTETSAICHYLCQHAQQLLIHIDQNDYWDFCFIQHFADASLMPLLLMKQLYAQTTQRTPWLLRWVSLSFQYSINRFYLTPELHQHLKQLDMHFSRHEYAAFSFSYADILLWFPLKACRYALKDFAEYAALVDYLNRLESRPAFQAALQKGEWHKSTFKHYWAITQ
ncbi:hypothetical protein A3K93_03960 [Acinetobacter sp. NCu2D-2]|uniref:glutathione S-transferase N-terminal domain-containing protein n=1 Tax=Acinetobacter sp. NCu2D-2 TaxID=1608473 RepID=UPI0007CDA037|nr:glutathione S-transferase N-terminal domain-containing protein [Acinetobacter sp. NCu2D-2]ANF81432.1 hypothetical protein A3K93_03960 [Acinetobacter sp. NCu2D-2]